jgi:predicted ATPase/DNA-binding SARP family transcriptional activator
VGHSNLSDLTWRMTDSLEIRLLGPFEIFVAGQAVAVSGSKRHGLLAMLALRRGRVLPVDELIDALWGEELPAAPRNALQHHVARLRAVLGQGAITAAADGYALADSRVDALRFEEALVEARAALREGDPRTGAASVAMALSLWRGSALQGLTDTAWFRAEAQRLESLRVDALEEQFEAGLALGEHREILSALRLTVDENPYRERLWGQLMLALYRSGRQADALEIFHDARQVFSEQLGLEPGPELRRLQEAILAQDPAIAAVPPAPRRSNLRTPTTLFVDREDELAKVVELLREHRLVTLTGPPGVGKSRLALEVARTLEGETADGVSLVELANAGGPTGVLRLVAQAVDARGPDPLARVIARLRNAEAILLFDACEHALEEAARVAAALLADCAGVRLLATSSEVLHLTGEARLVVRPLALGDPEPVAASPALQLFAARARAARPGFELTAESVPVAAEIARRVDGLPLAIELAAARMNVLGLSELLSAVKGRPASLDEHAVADPSLTALRRLVEWSYDLLHADERTLLHQLVVHRGGASLPSLLALAAEEGLDEATATYLLGALVDKSIVTVSFPEDEARYYLLDTVREYALERLIESGRFEVAVRAHAEYFAALADAARTELRAPARSPRLAWTSLARENDNLWAALGYAREARDAVVAARLAAGLGWYFGIAERVAEGRAFIEAALATGDEAPLPLRIELLAYLCYLATEEGDLVTATEAGERGLALASESDAPWENAMLKLALAFAYDRTGSHDRAIALADDARRTFDEVGDTWGVASAAVTGALGALGRGDIERAAALTAEAVRLHADYDVGAIPAALLEARLAEQRGNAAAAAAAYRRALERSERAGFADHAAFALTGLGSIAFANGDLDAAEAHYRRALAVANAVAHSWLVAHTRARLAQVLERRGDAEAAAVLQRAVIEWSHQPRRHDAREALFIALAGSPDEVARLNGGTLESDDREASPARA